MSDTRKDPACLFGLLARLSPVGLGLLAGFAVFALDQLSKYALRVYLVPEAWSLIQVLPVFNLNHAWNYGVSFSLFTATDDSRRWALILLALVLCSVVAYWLKHAATRGAAVAYGLILGGAMGNVCDRVVHGAVFDFLQFHLAGYYWPSFNLADSAIFLGVCFLVWEGWAQGRRQQSGE